MLRITSLFLLILISLNTYSQTKKENPWIIDFKENVNLPFTEKEVNYIVTAYGEKVFERIKKIKPLEKNIKDILRNRVEILTKKFYPSENIPILSSVNKSKNKTQFNINNFNPLLYDFDFDSNRSHIYRVQGTDYIINVIPKKLK